MSTGAPLKRWSPCRSPIRVFSLRVACTRRVCPMHADDVRPCSPGGRGSLPRGASRGTVSCTVALDVSGSIGATPLGAMEAPAVDHLLELLDRPAWQRDALCREYVGKVNFFP